MRCNSDNFTIWTMTSHTKCGVTRFSTCQNSCGPEVLSYAHASQTYGACGSHFFILTSAAIAIINCSLLRYLCNASHGCNSFYRIGTIGCFARQHNRISTIQNGVGYVTCFRTCRTWVLNHRLEHLCRRNNGFPQVITFFTHHLLKYWHLYCRNFYTEIATSNHESIRNFQDFIDIFNAFCIFNFRDNLYVFFLRLKNATNSHNVFAALHEGCGHKVYPLLTTKAQVCFILFRYGWQA